MYSEKLKVSILKTLIEVSGQTMYTSIKETNGKIHAGNKQYPPFFLAGGAEIKTIKHVLYL